MSPGNVYIYFGSKLEILYAIYDPWLRARIEALEEELARDRNRRSDACAGCSCALWRDIPAEENGFLNNIMQAISATDPSEGYRSTLVRWLEKRIAAHDRRRAAARSRARWLRARALAHVLIMAFDGFAIDRHLHPDESADRRRDDQRGGGDAGRRIEQAEGGGARTRRSTARRRGSAAWCCSGRRRRTCAPRRTRSG